jgi:hypothetical protein
VLTPPYSLSASSSRGGSRLRAGASRRERLTSKNPHCSAPYARYLCSRRLALSCFTNPSCKVLEETGYDISRQIHADDVITMTIRDQHVSLYLVPGVPEDFPFQTRTKKEISVRAGAGFPSHSLTTSIEDRVVQARGSAHMEAKQGGPGKVLLDSTFHGVGASEPFHTGLLTCS